MLDFDDTDIGIMGIAAISVIGAIVLGADSANILMAAIAAIAGIVKGRGKKKEGGEV